MANENDRSKFINTRLNPTTEVFRRSNHNDFATSSELSKKDFSGWRHNSLTEVMELWVAGEVVRRVTAEDILKDPNAMEVAYAEYFGLT
jgi:hypothetical protein